MSTPPIPFSLRAPAPAFLLALLLAAPCSAAAQPSVEPPEPPRPPLTDEEATRAVEAPAAEAPTAEASTAEPPGSLDLFATFTRAQLTLQGFVRHQGEAAGRAIVWWERGAGPALVMLHGVADQAGTWFQIASSLTDRYRVLLIDLPGHGESPPDSGPLPMTTVVEGFEGWLATYAVPASAAGAEDTAARPQAILVGNSMGAWVAILAALHHPELVSRVVMINGGPLRPDTGGLDLLPESREEARALMAALRDPASPPTPDLVLDDLVRRAKNGAVRRMFQVNDDLEGYLLEDRLGEISVPVDLLWGASDRYLGEDFPHRLVNGLPRARLTWIEGCGHLPQAECPQLLRARLEALLASPPATTGPATESDPGSPAEGR